MHKRWAIAGLLALGFFLGANAHAEPPSAAAVLRFRPHIEGVNYSTPAPEEQNACKVELVKGESGGSGWQVFDPQGRILRRFFDSNGDKKLDVWSYYLDGVEVYREIDSNFDGKPDQFRWVNAGGMKWGLDSDQDGKIDAWKMISAEEVSQEILQAIITKDFARLQPLFISPAEIKALDLSATESARLVALQAQAAVKFQTTLSKLSALNEKTRWVHLETAAPECVPADASGAKQDILHYARATILCETNGKHEWIQTGEIIQVGAAWRIVDSPGAGDGSSDSTSPQVDPALQALLDKLRDHDAKAPKGTETPAADIVSYNLQRADLLEQIVGKVKPEEREQWIRQIADCLGAASQNSGESDKSAFERLRRLEDQLIKAMPGSNLAAYVVFREMQADNSAKLAKPSPEIVKIQELWLDRLTQFVETYPRAEDAPEALMQLGMVSEFVNKEEQAKKWYSLLAKNFADNPLAAKAQGAMRRLDLEGKPLELAGTLLDGTPFDMAQLRGHMVIVYYWASWNKDRCISDFAVLKSILSTYKAKGVTLVGVNLDNNVQTATAFVQSESVPGVHLFQAPGGLDSPLATQYGVTVLPNLFLVNGDGKVVNRNIQQISNLEEELKKRTR